MLKERLIPTPLIAPGEHPPIPIVPIQELGFLPTVRVVLSLGGLVFWLLRARLRRTSTEAIGKHVCAVLADLGGLWIKAGQLISMRIDLVPQPISRELSNLQYRTDGFDPRIARQVVEQAIGRPIEEVFDVFEDHPFAAASISQEHRAHLRAENVWVVVKVQRPGVQRLFARDLKLITWLLGLSGRTARMSFMNLDGMMRELRQMMREELDYRYELGNMIRMRKLLRKHNVYVPKLFTDYSGAHVITMEEIPGVVMSDYLQIAPVDPERIERWCRANNIKPRKVGARLISTFYRQLFEDNLFHGDLHPGNIILLRNSRFSLIDFGTIGHLELRFVRTYRDIGRATAQKDYGKTVELYLQMCDVVPMMNVAALKADMVEAYRNWEARVHMYGLSYIDKSISGSIAFEIQNLAAKYQVNPSWQYLRVGRAIMTLDANLAVLLGDADPIKLLKRYFRQARRRAFRNARRQVGSQLADTTMNVLDLVNRANDFMRRQGIEFQGVQTSIDSLIALVFRVAKVALGLSFLLLLYRFLYDHFNHLVSGVQSMLGDVGQALLLVPGFSFGVHLLVLGVVLFLCLYARRIEKRFSRAKTRLPTGRLES